MRHTLLISSASGSCAIILPLLSQQRADDALMARDGVSGDHVLVGFFLLCCILHRQVDISNYASYILYCVAKLKAKRGEKILFN